MSNSVRFIFSVTIAMLIILAFGSGSECMATSAAEINAKSDAVMERFYERVGGGKALVDGAKGVLIFPSVVKAGLGIGGEYGEGAMRIGGKTVEYYNTAAGSIGFQLGIQSKAVILVFLDGDALKRFRNSDGWEVGVDGSVALIKIGASGSIDTTNIKDPIAAFVMTNRGLMYNLTLEGSKFTKIAR